MIYRNKKVSFLDPVTHKMTEESFDTVYDGEYVTSVGWSMDGIHIESRDGNTILLNCVVDLTALPLKSKDENVSAVNGVTLVMYHCYVTGGTKAILIGSGDNPDQDSQNNFFASECIISGCCRRTPEIQDGGVANFYRCIISWGEPKQFDTRYFGAWAHHRGVIICDSCVFFKHSFKWKNFFVDLGNHIGNMFNFGYEQNGNRILGGIGYCLKNPIHCLLPGQCRALSADFYGIVSARDCWFNKWWMYRQESKDELSAHNGNKLFYDIFISVKNSLEKYIDIGNSPILKNNDWLILEKFTEFYAENKGNTVFFLW